MKQRMPTIELTEGVGFGAILCFASGVQYGNQTGGTCCLRSSVEGVFVPLANDFAQPGGELLGPDSDLFAYFEGPKHQGAGATGGLDEEDAVFIDAVLGRWRLSNQLQVDRARLHDSHEAWVWAIVTGEEDSGVFTGFGPYPRAAVLTWTNTD